SLGSRRFAPWMAFSFIRTALMGNASAVLSPNMIAVLARKSEAAGFDERDRTGPLATLNDSDCRPHGGKVRIIAMCGIAGCATSSAGFPEVVLEGIRRMLHHMRRRGPDAEGVWSDAGVVLGHRRLAILDLAARANQPLVSAGERYSIVFNGEIYNFREL